MTPILVFTDLDGSLLDHDGYSFDDARPALARIRETGRPLVIVTSKTRAEVETLRAAIDVDDAFIVENGGGIYLPPRYDGVAPEDAQAIGGYRVITLGAAYPEIRAFVASLAPGLGVRGFGDMSDEEVAERTGLPIEAARRARRREFSEPFVIERERDLDEVDSLAATRGLALTTGGRFHHLIGAGQDKGRAVGILIDLFRRRLGDRLVSVGIGDGPNDAPMLERVDVPIVIPSASGRSVRIDRPVVHTAPCPGSRGWNAAVLRVLDELEAGGAAASE